MNSQKATLKIHLRDEDISDGLRERIVDVAFKQGAENDGSDLVYTISDDDEGELIERINSFKLAMWKLFDAGEVMSLVTVKYATSDEDDN